MCTDFSGCNDAELMDEIVKTFVEWGEYDQATELLIQSRSAFGNPHENSRFKKFHFLAALYDRQGFHIAAEKLYNQALNSVLEGEPYDSLELSLFLKNYAECLRKTEQSDVASGFDLICETLQSNSFLSIASSREEAFEPIQQEVANVA